MLSNKTSFSRFAPFAKYFFVCTIQPFQYSITARHSKHVLTIENWFSAKNVCFSGSWNLKNLVLLSISQSQMRFGMCVFSSCSDVYEYEYVCAP